MVHHVVYLQSRGLRLEVEGDRLMVSPRSRLAMPADAETRYTPEAAAQMRDERAALDAYIREHKPAIMAALASPDMWEERRRAYGDVYRAAAGDRTHIPRVCVECDRPAVPGAYYCADHGGNLEMIA